MSPRRSQPPPDPTLELDAPEGYEYRWLPDESSRLATEEEQASRSCRRPGCQRKPVVIALMRGFGEQKHAWLYCDWHMYGRRIVDGRVMWPALRRIGEDEP